MTGSGTGVAYGTGVLLGAGALNLGGSYGFINQLDNWVNGAPVIGFGDGTFSSWLNGVPVCEPGGASVLPIGSSGTCTGTGTLGVVFQPGAGFCGAWGTGTLKGTGQLSGSGSGGCFGTGTMKGAGALHGSGSGTCTSTGVFRVTGRLGVSGSGTCTGTGTCTGFVPPTPLAHFHVSPTQPTLRHADFVNDKWWSRRVSPKSERQRVPT